MPLNKILKERDGNGSPVVERVKQDLTVDQYGVSYMEIEKVWDAYCAKNTITDKYAEWHHITEELGTNNTKIIIDKLGGI